MVGDKSLRQNIRAAVVGYGNIGKAAVEALRRAGDFELVGVVRRIGSESVAGVPTVDDIGRLPAVDVALLCGPSRGVPKLAARIASMGVHTDDSFDIHASIADYVMEQHGSNIRHGTVSVVAAGWDPGSDSVLRALFEAMVPEGTTHTNFGPGMSMGHSVAARAVPGVRDAMSLTIPEGKGAHSRKVYVELEDGADFDDVAATLRRDAYFAHDVTRVERTDCVRDLINTGHGVLLEREGASSGQTGQRLSFDMRINNPALTAQLMVSCGRAAARMPAGCYTLIDIPPALLLPGGREEIIRRLV